MTLFRLPMLGRLWSSDPYQDAEERRRSFRYPALEPEITVGWWAGDQFHTCPALIQNISLGGMAVRSEQWPEGAEMVSVKAGDAVDPSAWVDVDWLNRGVRRWGRRGKFQLHMRFPQSCPYDFFTRVTAGDSRDAQPPSGGEESDSYHWR